MLNPSLKDTRLPNGMMIDLKREGASVGFGRTPETKLFRGLLSQVGNKPFWHRKLKVVVELLTMYKDGSSSLTLGDTFLLE